MRQHATKECEMFHVKQKGEKMPNKHESKQLNDLLGKRVKVLLYGDEKPREGILEKSIYSFRYQVCTNRGNYVFAKSLVKKIEVVK